MDPTTSNSELVKAEPAGEIAVRRPQAIDIEGLFRLALEKGIPVENMERMMSMRKEMKAEAAKEAYTAALTAFQSECPIIGKPKSVTNRDGSHRYSFAPLEYIVKETQYLREKHGFSFEFDSVTTNLMVKAICMVTHRDGHSKPSTFEAPIDAAPGMNKMQAYASALSYSKRYAFLGAFGIVTGEEDDDANSLHEDKSARKQFEQMKAKREGMAQEAQIVHPGEQEDPERPMVTHVPGNITKELEAFLLSVNTVTDPETMTNRWRIATEFTDVAQRKAAKDKVGKVAKELGFYWDFSNKCFINQKS